MINSDRLKQEFHYLASINSPPFREGQIARYLAERFASLGAKVVFDTADENTGGEVGNLVAKLPGKEKEGGPLLFSVHMDTVEPGGQVIPVFFDGVFYSEGDTILGADDKAAIAELIEALTVIQEQVIPHVAIEVVVTIAEEVGLVGAKNLDFSLLEAKRGYALDTEGTGWMVLQAPGANRMTVQVEGVAAHAGMAPEKGLSAIQTMALALSKMRLGRIDHETTANIGRIEGGVARNIIPQHAMVVGEARSHNPDKLRYQTEHMLDCFESAADEMVQFIDGERVRPVIRKEVNKDFPSMNVPLDAETVTLAKLSAESIGQELKVRLGGGGSDANIFNDHGIEMIILSTGMKKVHSHDEHVALKDMIHVTELLIEIIRRS